MKREILFRGKRVDNGKWVEGYYYANPIETLILPLGYEISITLDSVKVIPETIGQFTGLTDKNGVKIFEGDVIRYIEHSGYLLNSFAAIVCYDSLLAAFGYINNTQFMYYFSDFDEIDVDFLSHTEVIGNIHDNPELLNNGKV